MEVKHKNLKDDLKLLVSLGDAYDGSPFRVRFTSGKLGAKHYDCTYDGETYVNCEKVDDKHIICLLDNHGLPCGLVSVEMSVRMKDSQMPDDDYRMNGKKLLEFLVDGVPYHLELTNGLSDTIETVEARFELLGTVLKGDPFVYEDFTEEQLSDFRKPAEEASKLAKDVILLAERKINEVDEKILSLDGASEIVDECEKATKDANSAADAAINAAQNAAGAKEAIEEANIAAQNANNAINDVVFARDRTREATVEANAAKDACLAAADKVANTLNVETNGNYVVVTNKDGEKKGINAIGSLFIPAMVAPTQLGGGTTYQIAKENVNRSMGEPRVNVDYVVWDSKLMRIVVDMGTSYLLDLRADLKGDEGNRGIRIFKAAGPKVAGKMGSRYVYASNVEHDVDIVAGDYLVYTPSSELMAVTSVSSGNVYIKDVLYLKGDKGDDADIAGANAAIANANAAAQETRNNERNREEQFDNAMGGWSMTFNEAEGTPDDEFIEDEYNSRWAKFNKGEEDRQATFESKEAARDHAMEAVTNSAEKLDELALKINEVDGQINGEKKEVWSDVKLTQHRYYNLNIQAGASVPAAGGTSSTNIACAKVTINKGDAIKIKGAGGTSTIRPFGIFNNGLAIALSVYTASVNDCIIALLEDGSITIDGYEIGRGDISQKYDSIDVAVNLNGYYDAEDGTYYIKTRSYGYGKGLIDRIQSLEERPVGADIVDSLDSNDDNKALSAKQGKVLNEKIEGINRIESSEFVNFKTLNAVTVSDGVVTSASNFYVSYFSVRKDDIINFSIVNAYKQRNVNVGICDTIPAVDAALSDVVSLIVPEKQSIDVDYIVKSDGYLCFSTYYLPSNTGYYASFVVTKKNIRSLKDAVVNLENKDPEVNFLWARLKSGVLHNCGSYGMFEDNTKETFESVKLFGEIGKVDVRITADDYIVCCHDAGIRILDNGTYTKSYDGGAEKEGSTVYDIRSITKEFFCSFQWGSIISSLDQSNLPYLTDFESVLRIFRRDEIIPFITIRDTYTEETVEKIVWYLNKYNMMDSVIFNIYPASFTTLDIIKKKMPNAVCAYTLLSGSKVTKAIIDRLAAYKYVYYRIWDTTSDNSLFYSCLDVIEYGQQKGVTFHAIGNTPTDVALKYGAINVGARGWGDFKKFSVMLNLSVSGNEVDSTGSISIGYGDKKKAYICDAARVGNEIHISNIKRYYDSNEDLPAITPHWIKFFPISVKASGCGVTSTSVDKNNFKFVLSASDGITDGTLLVSITVGEL